MDNFFKVLADETRLRCLALIYENQELCVCELIHSLALPQSKISRHLSTIRLHNVINHRREGQWVLYSVNPELSQIKQNIIESSVKELRSTQPYIDDRKRLLNMENRPSLSAEVAHV